MSQFTIALCFFIAILAMAGTVLVLTIIYFFRQTSSRSQAAASSAGPAKETGTPVTEKSAAPPVKPGKPARKNGFFWNRKKKAGKEQKEKVIPAVHTAPPAVEAKSPPLKVFKPQQLARLKTLFGGLLKTGGRKKLGKAKPTVNTTVYDSAVVAAAVASSVAVPAKVPPKPAPEVNVRPAPKPVTPVAAAATPKFVLPKKPVPVAGVNIDLPPVSVKNMMPGTPAAPVIGANDKNKVELTKPVAKEIKPEMGNKDVKQPEKPAAEKAPAPPPVKPPASPAPAEPKKVSEFSSLGDLSKMFSKEVVDDSEATKLAKNMKDVEISDLLKSGHDIADLLKRH